MITIENIIEKTGAYLLNFSRERVLRAYDFAQEAHKGQTRFSGEPYIIHPLNVAFLLLDFHPDEDTIIAALLHDIAEDTERTLDDIENAFGPTVRSLCWGMEKLSKVHSKLNEPQVENLRKLFLAMAKDVRVILLKLCDRLHNMVTLEYVRPEKRTRIAQETLNIYAPIAARLGIYRLKTQLEDLCFQHLYPVDYQRIQDELLKTGKFREKYIDTVQQMLREILVREGLQVQIDGRMKSTYSIYRKLMKKNRHSIDEIFDIFAMRIILPDIYKYGKEYTGHLYTTLGILHNYFTPLANRFKDYIAVPKVNGYRSLHTTIMGLGPKVYTQPTEIQIRTNSMHQYAELGIAAHWLYEEGDTSSTLEVALAKNNVSFLKQHKDWIEGLHNIGRQIESNQELVEHLKVDIFQDRIFVLTPRGHVKDLPAGATPVDFAYAVHTNVGNRCIGAKVNGNIVPLNYELKSGEVTEILTRKNASPSQQWFSFVKTSYARTRIRTWFRNLDEDKHLHSGKQLLNQKLRQLGRPPIDVHLSLLRYYDGKDIPMREREELLREIGKGALFVTTVLKKILTTEELLIGRKLRQESSRAENSNKRDDEASRFFIGGVENMPYHFVQCCQATVSDDLLGYVTRGRGVSVHKKNCSVLQNIEKGRIVPIRLYSADKIYPVMIKIEAMDRLGLMRDIAKTIADASLNIRDFNRGQTTEKIVELFFLIDIEYFDQLERLLSNLEKIESVRRALKVNSGARV